MTCRPETLKKRLIEEIIKIGEKERKFMQKIENEIAEEDGREPTIEPNTFEVELEKKFIEVWTQKDKGDLIRSTYFNADVCFMIESSILYSLIHEAHCYSYEEKLTKVAEKCGYHMEWAYRYAMTFYKD